MLQVNLIARRELFGETGKLRPLNDSAVEAYQRLSPELFMVNERLFKHYEDTGNVYAKIRALKEVADITFKEFEYGCNLGYFTPSNKAERMQMIFKELDDVRLSQEG